MQDVVGSAAVEQAASHTISAVRAMAETDARELDRLGKVVRIGLKELSPGGFSSSAGLWRPRPLQVVAAELAAFEGQGDAVAVGLGGVGVGVHEGDGFAEAVYELGGAFLLDLGDDHVVVP